MKLIPIHTVKFGASVMISQKQESSVTAGTTRKGTVTINYDPAAATYIIERDNQLTLVHATNVQYAVPSEIRTVDEYCSEAIHSITETSMPESVIDADTQTARRRGRPRAEG